MGSTLITTHENSDMDALASAFAATRLHPGAQVGIGARVSPSVQRFLGLHRGRFPVLRCTHIDLAGVTKLVVTDVRRRNRLGHVATLLDRVPTKVWDHHPASDDDVSAEVAHVERVGAVTTLLCERLAEEAIPIDPLEATLFALGIHEDTGGFTYATTTARDARAFAWTLERGASLGAIERFTHVPVTAAEQAFLRALLDGVEQVDGHAAITHATIPKAMRGVARLVAEALECISADALFAVLRQGRRTQIIARARGGSVDVGAVLQTLGGGGHRGAGAAVVRASAEEASTRLRAELARRGRPAVTVRDVMSSPVLALARDTSVAEARALLEDRGFSGAPVTQGGRLVGVVSFRDLDRALDRGDGTLPIASCMSHDVRSVPPEAGLGDALTTMERFDVGRLPVLEGHAVVGIVTRTHALASLYPRV